MAQSYGPNKTKPARGRGRARRYDALENRDCDGERDSYQASRSSNWQTRPGDYHDRREGRSSPFQPTRPGDFTEARDGRVSPFQTPSGRSARNGPSAGSAPTSRSRPGDDSYSSGTNSEKKKSRQRRPEMQVYVPRGRRQLGASGGPSTRDADDEPARRGSDDGPLNQDENSSRPGSASASRGRRVRAGAEPYVPRARRMQYHMSAADNENNENMCKQLLLTQGGAIQDDGDINSGAAAQVAPPSGHYTNEAQAMDVQADGWFDQTHVDSWKNSSLRNQGEVMCKDNAKISVQRKRKKSSSLDQKPENTDAQFKNSQHDGSVMQSEQFDISVPQSEQLGGSVMQSKQSNELVMQSKQFDESVILSNELDYSSVVYSAAAIESDRCAVVPSGPGPTSEFSSLNTLNKTVSELRGETQLNESSDDEASWEMAPESFNAQFEQSPKALTDMDAKTPPQTSFNETEISAERLISHSAINSLVEREGPNSPETSFEIPRKDRPDTASEMAALNCPETVQISAQNTDHMVSQDIVKVSISSSDDVEISGRGSEQFESEQKGLETECKRLSSEHDEFESERKGLETKCKRLSSEHDGFESECKGLETECKTFESEHDGFESERKGLETECKTFESEHAEFDTECKEIEYVPDDNQNLPDDHCEEKYKISDELMTELESGIVACDSIKNEVTLCSSQNDVVLTTDDKVDVSQCGSRTLTDGVLTPETSIDGVTSSVKEHSAMEIETAKDLPVSENWPVSTDVPVSEMNVAETASHSDEISETQDSNDDESQSKGADSVGEIRDSIISDNQHELEGNDTLPVHPWRDRDSDATRSDQGKSVDVDGYRDEDAGSTNADDEDSWEALFDDSGECLDSHLMDELARAVGEVKVEKPSHDYSEFSPKDLDGDYEAYTHLVEIYDFPSELLTRDLIAIFRDFTSRGFDIKWVDDTHAVGIFSSTIAAKDALSLKHPLLKVRPISEATRQTKLKAKRCSEFMLPYKPRPETNASCARRLVTGALGLNTRVSREQREQERKQLKDAREKKRLAAKQKQDAWDGTIDKCAMDET